MDERLQQMIAERVRVGQRIDEIEEELAPPGEEQHAAVWLYAWLEHEHRERRFGRRTPTPTGSR